MESDKWDISLLAGDLNETRLGDRDQVSENVFQIIPKLCIQRSSTQPQLIVNKPISGCLSVSIAGSKNFAVALESDLLIFDSKIEKVEKRVSFNHSINFLTCNRSLLLVGLSSSEIVFINSSTFGITESRWAESEEVSEKVVKEQAECRFFVEGYIYWRGDIVDVIAVAVNGNVYHFQTACEPNSTLDFTRLEKTNVNDMDGTLGGRPKWKASSGSTMISTSYFFGPNYLVFTENLSCRISLVELISGVDAEFDIRGIVTSDLLKDLDIMERKISIKKLVRCEGLLFVLLSTGRLEILFDEVLFPTHPLKLPIENGFIHDFEVVLSGEIVKLWTIYCPWNCSDPAYLAIFSGPSFCCELVIALPISAIKSSEECTTPTNDNMINISIRFNQQSSYCEEPSLFTVMSSSGVKIFQVLESSTDITLQRLLAQGKFNLANALAEKYCINIDVVKKAQVSAYFNDLLSPGKAKHGEKIFQLMMSTLESINDDDFVCAFSIHDHENMLPKIEWVQKLLNLGLKRVHAVDVDRGRRLLLTGEKFYTFQQVMPSGTIEDWRNFCRPENSMFDVCFRFIQNGQYEYCNCVWTRHAEEFIDSLDLNTLGTVFWALFNQQLKTPACILLFTTVLDDTLNKCVVRGVSAADNQQEQENKLLGMLDMVKRQICFLETKTDWPHEAVKFVETLINVFIQEESKHKGMIMHERLVEPEWEQKLLLCEKSTVLLKALLQALKELLELRTSHSMRIPFQTFINDDLVEVVNALFDVLFSREEINKFVMKFLKPFAHRKHLDLDSLYQKHIESVLQYLPFFANMAQIPFEERLFCLVELTTNMKMKLESLLNMVQNWSVPWSPGLDILVAKILDTNNSGAVRKEEDETCQQLRRHIALVKKQVPYQCILNKYRLTASKLTSSGSILLGLKRILLSKLSNCDKDSLEFVKHTGKFDEEFVRMYSVQLNMMLVPLGESLEDDDSLFSFASSDLSNSATVKLKDRCLASIRSSQAFRNVYSTEYLARQSENALVFSQKSNDMRAIEFLNLRKLFSNLNDQSILYSADYPFSVLDLMLDQLHVKPSKEILNGCSKLSTISFYPMIDILVAVVIAFVSLSYVSSSTIQKTWDILTEIVSMPSTIRSSLLKDHLENAVHLLIMNNQFNSYEHQVVLANFLKMLIESFDSCESRFCKLYDDHRIFMSFREREIPLEKEFLSIYKVLSGQESKSLSILQKELEVIGHELIKYGEHDLLVTIMNAVLAEYEEYKRQSVNEEDINNSNTILECLSRLKQRLVEKSFSYKENETDPHVLSLVKCLCSSGIFVNAFSLRRRNKTILINKLLDINEFRLASEVALVFEFREKEPWSSIIQGFMNNESPQNLQRLLTQLKRITQLWVLPEFTAAWLQVSESYPSFKNMCPIPLI